MKILQRLTAVIALICASLAFGQTKTPLIQPHWVFFNQSGAACAGCSLFSYLAGTTTPTPTYSDATGDMNTNPIILGTDGGANIFVGTVTYKLALYDTLGNLVWTADNIQPGSLAGGVCGPASTIQISNSSVTGLSCDALITINNIAHTINVGGPLPTIHFTLANLSAISSSWTMDVTSPTTAALSIGGGTAAAGKYIDGGTGQWTALPGSSSGTVTSVAATVPAQMTVGGSPITTSGTLAFGLHTTGSETDVVTAAAAGASGNCPEWDSSGGLSDSGGPCGLGQTTLTGTNGVYSTFSCTVSGVAHTCYQVDINTGALNNNTTTTVTLPHAIPTAIFSIVCTDNGSRVQSGNDQAVGANVSGQIAPYSTIQVNTPASGMSAYCVVRGY